MSAREAARRLRERFTSEPESAPGAPPTALIFGALRYGLERSIGRRGYQALLGRAFERMREGHPDITAVPFHKVDESVILVAIDTFPHGMAAGTDELVVAVIDMLGRVVGEDLAIRLIDQVGVADRPDSSFQARHGIEEPSNE